jgi:hypothetical protein
VAPGGQHVQHLEFGWIGIIAARHAQIAQDVLRENTTLANSDCPETNMWWPYTKNAMTAMETLAQTANL